MRSRLRDERVARRLTQVAVSQRVGVTVRTYQNYESGHRTPSLKVANQLEDLFQVPIRVLLQDDPRQERQPIEA